MRLIAAIIMLLGICQAFVGCASRHKSNDERSSEDQYRRALAAVATVRVPLLEHTPYDFDPEGRGTYLDSYQEGYRTGLSGYYVTPMFQVGNHHRERVAGYYAGLSAGWQVWSQSNLGPGPHFIGERPAKAK